MWFQKGYWKYLKIFSLLFIIIMIIKFFRNEDFTQSPGEQFQKFQYQIIAIQDSSISVSIGDSEREKQIVTAELLNDSENINTYQISKETLDVLRSFPTQPFIFNGTAPSFNKSCAKFPTLFDIVFDNNWQIMDGPIGTAYLYGAYYDSRNLTMTMKEQHGPAIRILGMMDTNMRLDNKTSYFCQMWYEGQTKPVFSTVTSKTFYWKQFALYKRAKLQLFLFACDSQNDDIVPQSVSLAVNHCENATNNLRVQYEQTTPERKNFAVCVKGLDFFHEDLSFRLVEWIELLRLLGADKIFLYELAVHSNTSKVLRYYENTGYVDVTRLTLPGGLPNDPSLRHIYLEKQLPDKRANEMIPYNDCIYRNIHNYKYLALLDTDEIIVPLMDSTWNGLLSRLKRESQKELDRYSAICFRNTYFFNALTKNQHRNPDIPLFMHTLQNVYRSVNYTEKGFATKCFHNTERVIISHNHFPAYCHENCTTLYVDTNMAHLHHYKMDCPNYVKNCSTVFRKNYVFDNNLWRYKDKLIKQTVTVLQYLGLL